MIRRTEKGDVVKVVIQELNGCIVKERHVGAIVEESHDNYIGCRFLNFQLNGNDCIALHRSDYGKSWF
jgi:hypothetical protein